MTVLFGLFEGERCYGCGRALSRETRVALAAGSGDAGRAGVAERRCGACRAERAMTETEAAAHLAESLFAAAGWSDPRSPCS